MHNTHRALGTSSVTADFAMDFDESNISEYLKCTKGTAYIVSSIGPRSGCITSYRYSQWPRPPHDNRLHRFDRSQSR